MMNSFAHFFINFFLATLFFGDVKEYAIVILIASVIIDIDHIPYTIKNFNHMKKYGMDETIRTWLHEVPGVILISTITMISSFYVTNFIMLKLIYFSLMMHLIVDFLAGKSRPFYPFSSQVMVSPLGKTSRVGTLLYEVPISVLGGIYFVSQVII